MNYREHVLFGILLGIIYLILIPTELTLIDSAIFFFLVYFGSIIADIDHDKSRITHYIFVSLLFVVLIIGYLKFGIDGLGYGFGVFLLLCILYALFKPAHRGITHSLLFIIPFVIICYLAFQMIGAIAITIGMVSHLILDFIGDKT